MEQRKDGGEALFYPAKPILWIGATVEYTDFQGRMQIGKIQSVEASWGPWSRDGMPLITYRVTHPTYKGRRHYTGQVRIAREATQ